MQEKTTEELDKILKHTDPDGINGYLEKYEDEIVTGPRPFSEYFKTVLKEKGISQQQVFLRAEMSEKFGYRIISQERHTRQRDYILRLCLSAEFTLSQAQRALKIYGMSELYARIPRDAALIIAFNQGIHHIDKVNELLESHGMKHLKSSPDDA